MMRNARPAIEPFGRPVDDLLATVEYPLIPESARALAEENAVETLRRYAIVSVIFKDGVKALEEVMLAARAGAKVIGDEALHYTDVNVENAFDAAERLARANTIREAVRIQCCFVQELLVIGNEQRNALFELSAKVVKQSIDNLNKAAAKTFEQFKTVS